MQQDQNVTEQKPPLDPWRLDDLIQDQQSKVIWTAAAIAHRIGTSPDFVRDTLAKQPDSPVKKVGRRLCAVESELVEWFVKYPTQTH